MNNKKAMDGSFTLPVTVFRKKKTAIQQEVLKYKPIRCKFDKKQMKYRIT